MTVLHRREVPIRTLLAITPEQARALSAPVRLAMLELLGHRPMSIDELADELPHHGFRQAPNTLRHHLEQLRKAGLVEQAILEQTRGAILQYYAATSRPLHADVPLATDADVAALADRLRAPVGRALDELRTREGRRLARARDRVAACPRCPEGQAEEQILLSALQRAALESLHEAGMEPAAGNGRARAARRRG